MIANGRRLWWLKACIARIVTLLVLVPAFFLDVVRTAHSEVLIAEETSRGEYEKGNFTPGKPEFSYRFEVDEKAGTARLTEIVRLSNRTVIAVGVQYVITAYEDGTATSRFLVSEDRRDQRVLTLVGKPGSLATEVILLGENFFEYSKASSGRLYLATGRVRKAVSGADDALHQLLERGEKKSPERSRR